MYCQNNTSHKKAWSDVPAIQGALNQPSISSIIAESWKAFHPRPFCWSLIIDSSANEDLHQTLFWSTQQHALHFFFKQTRLLITARILTVEVPLHSWVHHLEMFSSGVVMLLIFYAVLPPRFLVRNVQNRVTWSSKPWSHTVSFLCVNVTL